MIEISIMPDLLEQLFLLYQEAFPAKERRTESQLRSALTTTAYQLLTKEENGVLLGFAILFIPPNQPFALIEYLAVLSSRRGAGIGGELVATAIERAHGRFVLTEVESDSTDPAALRRQQFYSRHGFCRINGLKYQLPLPGNPPPMELWIHPAIAFPIDRNDLARWIDTIYTDVYGCSHSDPRIAEMLATITT